MSDLVIVESPAKAKTIKKYLGSGYEVVASMGHVRDLPKSRLSVDIRNTKKTPERVSFFVWARQDLNPRPSGYEPPTSAS